MNKQSKRIKRISACLALFFSWSSVALPAHADLPPAVGSAPGGNGLNSKAAFQKVAELTFAKNTVKSDPISSVAMSPFAPAHAGDSLVEGTTLQTGTHGWATIEWTERAKNITRIWENSLVRVTPLARTVFLAKGQVVLKKDRKNEDCYLETKRLQARIHGTTVTLIADEESDYITVDETDSYVDVLNKATGSHTRLTPGVVLQVRGVLKKPEEAKKIGMILDEKGEIIFDEGKGSMTRAFVADARAILADPLIAGTDEFPPIETKARIEMDLRAVNGDNFVEQFLSGGRHDKFIAKSLKITVVPTRASYRIGPNVGEGKSIELPQMAYTTDHRPDGVVLDWTNKSIANSKFQQASVAHVALPVLPYTQNPATSADSNKNNNTP